MTRSLKCVEEPGSRATPTFFTVPMALSSFVISSDHRMDQEFSRRLSMSEVRDDSSAAKTLSAAARRSFFRRKHKHKRSGSKDGKDLLTLDAFSSDSIPLFEGK